MVRDVVGPGEGHHHVLVDGPAVAVVDADGVGLMHGLAGGQLLDGAVVDRIVPADRAAEAGAVVSLSTPTVMAPNCIAPSVEVKATEAVWLSLRSTSVKVTAPEAVSLGSWASSVTAPVWAEEVIIGASLVPVRVTTTSWGTIPPWPSLTLTV